MNILVINGPNLNLLGTREPEIYGTTSLKDIEDALRRNFPGVGLFFFQSNHEGAIIDKLQNAESERIDIAAIPVPVIEVHISNILLREDFRKESVTAPVCKAQVSGFGTDGYRIAVETLLQHSKRPAS